MGRSGVDVDVDVVGREEGSEQRKGRREERSERGKGGREEEREGGKVRGICDRDSDRDSDRDGDGDS